MCVVASTDDEVTSHGDSDRPEKAVPTHKFDIGSTVKHIHRYGVIKWIGKLASLSNKVYAGVEMVGNIVTFMSYNVLNLFDKLQMTYVDDTY